MRTSLNNRWWDLPDPSELIGEQVPWHLQPGPQAPDVGVPTRPDLREQWVGTERAASIYGIGRTQMWRLGKKWAQMMEEGETPPVFVVVLGTSDVRGQCGELLNSGIPEYKFHLATLQRQAWERRSRKIRTLNEKLDRKLRALLQGRR